MAQHDYVLENQTGQQFRQDLNNLAAAIVSQNSGPAEPAIMFAYQWWADTTAGLLKMRNAANNAWIVFGSLGAANGGSVQRSGDTMAGQFLAAVPTLPAVSDPAAPAIAFRSDPDTGVHRPADNQVSLVAGGLEMLRADFATYVSFLGTAGFKAPSGTTLQRPASPANGVLRYNTTTNKFEGYANAAWKDVGGGGGGAGFVWRAIAGLAPTIAEELGEVVNLFAPGASQELYAAVKLPNGYSPGSPVLIYVSAYSPSAAGTIALKAQATLIRKGTDAFDSVTNQRSSTNAALTNTVANQLREFVLDITDSVGAINGVAASPGDIIKVRLYRDPTDTDSADLRMIANATDVKFS